MRQVDEPNSFARAINATTKAIARRAGHYRTTVIAVVLIMIGVPLAAGLTGDARLLVALLFLVVVWLLFLVADAAALRAWQRPLLADWVRGDLDLQIFARSIRSIDRLPSATLGAMLELLPIGAEAPRDAALPHAARERVASAAALYLQDCQLLQAASGAAGAILAASALLTATLAGWIWLTVLLLLPVIHVAYRQRCAAIAHSLNEKLLSLKTACSDSEYAEALSLLNHLDWSANPIPEVIDTGVRTVTPD